MRKVESWVFGLVRREIEIFFSKTFDHIEVVKTIKVFGRTVKEEFNEVYLPTLKTLEQAKLKVIADAYIELHRIGKIIEEEFGIEEN